MLSAGTRECVLLLWKTQVGLLLFTTMSTDFSISVILSRRKCYRAVLWIPIWRSHWFVADRCVSVCALGGEGGVHLVAVGGLLGCLRFRFRGIFFERLVVCNRNFVFLDIGIEVSCGGLSDGSLLIILSLLFFGVIFVVNFCLRSVGFLISRFCVGVFVYIFGGMAWYNKVVAFFFRIVNIFATRFYSFRKTASPSRQCPKMVYQTFSFGAW